MPEKNAGKGDALYMFSVSAFGPHPSLNHKVDWSRASELGTTSCQSEKWDDDDHN